MADNVVALDPDRAPILPGQPVEDVVETLRDLLARAERGEIIGIAYATCNANDGKSTGWTGGAGTRYPLAASILMMQHRYASALLEGAIRKDDQT